MKRKILRIVSLILVCFTVLIASSCSAETELGDNTELGKTFVSCVIDEDYDGAYALVSATVGEADFKEYWENSILPVSKGALSYEIEQIGWNVNTSNGLVTRTTAYQVYLDNGETVLLRVVTRDDIEGIAGIHFSAITEFLSRTDALMPPLRIGLAVFSVLSFAFTVWMFVDCLRRRIKRKVLWAILIFLGVSVTISFGESFGLNFMLGLMLQGSTAVADPGLLAVQIKLVAPLGAILYLCLRKNLLLPPETEMQQVPADALVQPPTSLDPPAQGEPKDDNGAF